MNLLAILKCYDQIAYESAFDSLLRSNSLQIGLRLLCYVQIACESAWDSYVFCLGNWFRFRLSCMLSFTTKIPDLWEQSSSLIRTIVMTYENQSWWSVTLSVPPDQSVKGVTECTWCMSVPWRMTGIAEWLGHSTLDLRVMGSNYGPDLMQKLQGEY